MNIDTFGSFRGYFFLINNHSFYYIACVLSI
nr:MAG TPA: hypothetical protein [Caudoviricetes sp.]